MIPPCLTLSNIRYVSRLRWNNPGKGVAPFPTPRCSSYWKGSLLVALDYGRQLYFFYIPFMVEELGTYRQGYLLLVPFASTSICPFLLGWHLRQLTRFINHSLHQGRILSIYQTIWCSLVSLPELFLFGAVLPLCRGYCQHILYLAGTVKKNMKELLTSRISLKFPLRLYICNRSPGKKSHRNEISNRATHVKSSLKINIFKRVWAELHILLIQILHLTEITMKCLLRSFSTS